MVHHSLLILYEQFGAFRISYYSCYIIRKLSKSHEQPCQIQCRFPHLSSGMPQSMPTCTWHAVPVIWLVSSSCPLCVLSPCSPFLCLPLPFSHTSTHNHTCTCCAGAAGEEDLTIRDDDGPGVGAWHCVGAPGWLVDLLCLWRGWRPGASIPPAASGTHASICARAPGGIRPIPDHVLAWSNLLGSLTCRYSVHCYFAMADLYTWLRVFGPLLLEQHLVFQHSIQFSGSCRIHCSPCQWALTLHVYSVEILIECSWSWMQLVDGHFSLSYLPCIAVPSVFQLHW